MWTKQSSYYEQPNVTFRDELILNILDNQGNSTMYSTVKSINDQSYNELGQPLIRLNNFDTN
jgi:hypothetical protein